MTPGHPPNCSGAAPYGHLEAAREAGLHTIGLTGAGGGTLPDVTDLCIRVPSEDTPRVQELCMLLGYTLYEIVERELAGG